MRQTRENWSLAPARHQTILLANGAKSIRSWALGKWPMGKLKTNVVGFGVWSHWPDVNDLCNRTKLQKLPGVPGLLICVRISGEAEVLGV